MTVSPKMTLLTCCRISYWRNGLVTASLLLEELQIGRRLILLCRHQEAVLADIAVLLADEHMMVAVGALVIEPDRLRVLAAGVFLVGRERPRQRVVLDRDVVVQQLGVGQIKVDAFV